VTNSLHPGVGLGKIPIFNKLQAQHKRTVP